MNDLLSELDGIEVDGVSSRNKQDGSSSPLRPNPKYCSMVLSHPRAAARSDTRSMSSGYSSISSEGAWQNARERHSSFNTPSRIPDTVQKILAVAGAMEVDDDPLERPSSPIQPTEKYCKIIVPSRPPIARVAPLPGPGHSFRPVQPLLHQGPVWRDGDRVDGRRATSPYPTNRRFSDESSRSRDDPQYQRSYSNHDQPRNRSPSADHYYSTAPRGSRHSPPYADYSNHRYAAYAGNLAREKAVVEWNRQREIDEHKRALREEEKRKEEEGRMRAERERTERMKAKEDERRRHESERIKASEEKRRHETDRRARAQLKSYTAERPKREEGTVSMTREELEALKEKCIAEGKEKALADVELRKAEAIARLNRCLKKIETRNSEPEPMEVEESDVVESSVPKNSAPLVPIPLIIKIEPLPVKDAESKEDGNEKEVVESTEADGNQEESCGEEKGNEEVKKKDHEDEIVIIEKPPAEVITLSDSEGTVDETTIIDDRHSKEIKKEIPTASAEEDGEELWVINSKRGRKKKHVFDPSKVKKEKDESVCQVHETIDNENSPSTSFHPHKVKAEPTDKKASGKTKNEDMVAQSNNLIADEERTAGEKTTVVVPVRQERPPSRSLPDYDEHDGSAVLPKTVQQHSSGEDERQNARDIHGVDMNATLAAARRLIRQIDETVQSAQQQKQRQAQKSRQLHQPAPGSFMYSLRKESRKRSEWCDVDEDEEEWLRCKESSERHEWGMKRGKMEEEEEKEKSEG